MAFAVAAPAAILGLGMFGLLLASTFVLLPNANAIDNTLEYPIWLVSGMLVPITVLPGWTGPIGAVLPTTWAARAVRESVTGGGPVWPSLGVCLAISAVCLVAGAVRHVLRGASRPRERDPRPSLRLVAVRLLAVGGVIAYRALFNWTTPSMFVGTLLVGPLFQLLFFAFLGRQLRRRRRHVLHRRQRGPGRVAGLRLRRHDGGRPTSAASARSAMCCCHPAPARWSSSGGPSRTRGTGC